MSTQACPSVEWNIRGINVRKASTADVPSLRSMLTRAFDDDPFTNWLCHQDKDRNQRLARFFDMYFRILSLPYGEVYTTQNREGAALWSPPTKWNLGVVQQFRLTPDFVRITGLRHMRSRSTGLDAVLREHPKKPHWYLQVIGTEPRLQGRGIGFALLQPVLRLCDQSHVAAYVESSKEGNIPFYERVGFRMLKRITVPHGGPDLWLMWREPAEI